jgi:hypothetical protein
MFTTLWVVEKYMTPMAKIALACESAKVAKATTTHEEGIGEDLSYNLIAWHDTLVSAIAQLQYNLIASEDRLMRVLEAVKAMRLGYCINGITFVAEGYCVSDPSKIDSSTPLRHQFVTNQNVRECLTVTHVEPTHVKVVALPYTYEIGRRVRFDDPFLFPEGQATSHFVKSIQEVLMLEPDRQFTDDNYWRDSVAEEITTWGFHVHHDMSSLNVEDEDD